MAEETEVKFYLSDTQVIRERIRSLGAKSRGKNFETNLRFEDKNGSLLARKSLLRLRRDHSATLTYKCEPAVPDTEYKSYQELEITVSDFAITRQILEALGFHEEQVYEKYRETFPFGTTILCLDTMPYGDFLEIEGNREDIRSLADRLQLPWEERILTNYLNLFEAIKNRYSLGFSHITFDNFTALSIDARSVIETFQAGSGNR